MNEHFAGTFKATSIEQLGQCSGCSRLAPTPQSGKGSQNGLALIEVNVCDFAAVATMPPKRGAAESIGSFRL